jgi:hypothetical protein
MLHIAVTTALTVSRLVVVSHEWCSGCSWDHGTMADVSGAMHPERRQYDSMKVS